MLLNRAEVVRLAAGQVCLDLLDELLRVEWALAVRTGVAQLGRSVGCVFGVGSEDDLGLWQVCLHPTG